MEWKPIWTDPLSNYVGVFASLFGDRRTRQTFGDTIRSFIGAGSLICQRIAGQSLLLSQSSKGSQRVLHLARGESIHCSQVDAEQVTARLREMTVEQLEHTLEQEVWLIADSSDMRKPYAEETPYLMHVPDLQGKLVAGYRTINVIGVTS